MNLADMLCYADIQQLSSIANTYDCQCNGHSKNELIQSILSRVNRRDVFEQQLTKWSIEDIRFLNSIVFDKRDLFSLEELVARARLSNFANAVVGQPQPVKQEEQTWNPREMISKFKHSGWLFNGYSQQTRYLFQFPQDMKRRFTEALVKQFQSELPIMEEPSAYRDEQGLITDDIYHLLHHLYHHEVPITAEGFIYKRPLQQIVERMSVLEELPKGGWRFGYGRNFRDHPNRFSLIYDFCYYNDLLYEGEGLLALTDKGKLAVLSGKREDLSHVYRMWFKLYKNPIPNLQSIVYWIDRLAKDWIQVDSLARVLCTLIRPFYFDTSESVFEQRILQMMMHLGLLRLGEDEIQGRVVKMTKLGSGIVTGTYVPEEEKIILQIDNPPFPC